MEVKEIVYEKRPLTIELDVATKTLSNLMDSISAEAQSHWSFSGGFARDTYLGKPWNDYDICSFNTGLIQQRMQEMGVLTISQQDSDEIPHDHYVDPYDFNKSGYPIHWIRADDEWSYAPRHFDFSINQICLKSDGFFYAPTYTWRDLERKVIRKVTERMTTNIVMRAFRFCAKYDFAINGDLEDEIIKKIKDKDSLDTLALIRNAEKMVEDNVESNGLILMKIFGVPGAEVSNSINDFISYQNRMVATGFGRREPGNSRYNNW